MEEDWERLSQHSRSTGSRAALQNYSRSEPSDRGGNTLDFIVANDFHARVIQHEFDHLNGKVYLDRMRDLTTLTFLQEFARYWLRP